MIRTENAQLVNYIYVDMHDRDIGTRSVGPRIRGRPPIRP
jgi:hypothetical protein